VRISMFTSKIHRTLSQWVSSAVGAPTTILNLAVSVSVPAGQIVDSGADYVISIIQDTWVNVSVDPARLTVSFEPELTIVVDSRHPWVPNPTIRLKQLFFDYSMQHVGGVWIAPIYANWRCDIGDMLLRPLSTRLQALLPPRIFAKGYNPFDDQVLLADMLSIVSNFWNHWDGHRQSSRTSKLILEAQLSIDADVQFDQISIDKETHVEICAGLTTGVSTSSQEIQFESISVELYGPSTGANVKLQIFDTELSVILVRSARYSAGGGLSLTYDVRTEPVPFHCAP
jgi:hypothetical protein